MNVIHQGDALEWLKTLSDSSFDLICTDPPYASLEKHRAKGTTTRLRTSKASSNVWFPVIQNADFLPIFEQLFRVLKVNRHMYVFCDAETMFALKPIGDRVGFKFWKPLVWDKKKIGMGYHYRCRYEFILFFEKGKRKLNNLGIPDVLVHDRVSNGYPTEKPVSLLETLIGQSTEPGELVCDPFMGSGSTGVAAARTGRFFWGNDLLPDALAIAATRGVQSSLPIGLPAGDNSLHRL